MTTRAAVVFARYALAAGLLAAATSGVAARAKPVAPARPAPPGASQAPPASAASPSPVPAPGPAAGKSASRAEDLLRSIERRYASLRTLTAGFTQTFRSAGTGQQLVERGRIFVKRPGRMRWDYRQPDKKVFVVNADGTTLSYIPADLTAVRARLPADAPHLQLLMGESDLLESFAVTEVQLKDPVVPGSRRLRLTPRRPMEGIELVYLEADPGAATISRVLVLDALGNESDLVLDKVVENASLKEDAFDVRLPAGIEVRDAVASAEAR